MNRFISPAAARLLFIILLLFVPLISSAAVEEFRLDNGLRILFIEDHRIPIANFQIWYRVGSIDEPAGKSGMSHFLEHVMFKGTPKYGSKVFSTLIQKKGGIDNAFTTKDYTMYYQKIPSSAISLSITLEADRMKNLLLKPADIEAERGVIMEERRMRYEDDPLRLLFEKVIAAAMKPHPYSRPVIGWMSEIASLSRKDLADYYGAYYSPDNAFIIISGDVKPAEVMPLIRKEFGPIPPAGARIRRAEMVEPLHQGERTIRLESEAAQLPAVVMAYNVPSFPDKDNFAIDLLSSILSGGKSTRLYHGLVYKKRIAISADAHYEGINRAPFLFIVSATAAPGKDISEVEKALADEIELIASRPPSDEELQKAKNQTEAAFIFARDSSYSEALYTSIFEIVGGWKLKDKYLEGIRKVTAEEVSSAARRYLNSENRTIGYLIPKKAGK
jgi:zinc protease